ncbi:MAG: 3-isopropylmalate dehydrogenase, partial [bacterium]|nr:3-isopropylmalate dehydrogenase [bacterium]
IKVFPELADASPLRAELVAGVDILFVRELTGGIYFGESGVEGSAAFQVMRYTEGEVERIVRLAAGAARSRSGKLTMVDKANVLEPSRLWRRVAAEVVASEYSDLTYDVVLVDAMAMYLLSHPAAFDVVVTANLFGDILTDEASMITGSLGMLPSASVGREPPSLYEPVHGSAPDIAGTGLANPLAAILAAAMALRHSLRLEGEARAVESAVAAVIGSGLRTADIAERGPTVTTTEIGAAVIEALT